MLKTLGWVGNTLLALCAAPQALYSFRHKHSRDVPWKLLVPWAAGELLTFFYVLPTGNLPLLFNYVFNLGCLFVIIWYKATPEDRP